MFTTGSGVCLYFWFAGGPGISFGFWCLLRVLFFAGSPVFLLRELVFAEGVGVSQGFWCLLRVLVLPECLGIC